MPFLRTRTASFGQLDPYRRNIVCEENASRCATLTKARVVRHPFLVDGVFPEGKGFEDM